MVVLHLSVWVNPPGLCEGLLETAADQHNGSHWHCNNEHSCSYNYVLSSVVSLQAQLSLVPDSSSSIRSEMKSEIIINLPSTTLTNVWDKHRELDIAFTNLT